MGTDFEHRGALTACDGFEDLDLKVHVSLHLRVCKALGSRGAIFDFPSPAAERRPSPLALLAPEFSWNV